MRTTRMRPQNKLKTLQKGTLLVTCISVTSIFTYLFISLSQVNTTDSNAATKLDLLTADPINNGELVCGYTWDQGSSIAAEVGPSAEKISASAEVVTGGVDNTYGLSAGTSGRNINMFIPAEKCFNMDGIDIGLDFRRYEESGNFMTRGSYFNFGMKNGKLVINYKIKGEDGKLTSVDETSRYEIPKDTLFRNYRFLYNPQTSKGEIFVDNVAVWSNQDEQNGKLWWNETDPLIIGDEMNGDSKGKAIMDNLIIRSTARGKTMPLQLLGFTAEVMGSEIMLNWFTGKENGTDYFKIERSSDTHSYIEIGSVKAAGNSNELKAYALLDKHPQAGVTFYRLSMPNTNVKSVWVPIVALKVPTSTIPSMSGPITQPVNTNESKK